MEDCQDENSGLLLLKENGIRKTAEVRAADIVKNGRELVRIVL